MLHEGQKLSILRDFKLTLIIFSLREIITFFQIFLIFSRFSWFFPDFPDFFLIWRPKKIRNIRKMVTYDIYPWQLQNDSFLTSSSLRSRSELIFWDNNFPWFPSLTISTKQTLRSHRIISTITVFPSVSMGLKISGLVLTLKKLNFWKSLNQVFMCSVRSVL